MDAIVKKEHLWMCLRRDVIIPAAAIARMRWEGRIDIHGGHAYDTAAVETGGGHTGFGQLCGYPFM